MLLYIYHILLSTVRTFRCGICACRDQTKILDHQRKSFSSPCNWLLFQLQKESATTRTTKHGRSSCRSNNSGSTTIHVCWRGFLRAILVKKGRSLATRYGVLYTCLVVRAIHIEVADGLDTDSFINSLRRFISRRGAPEEIRSDSGTNFKGGNRDISEAISQWNLNQLHEFLLPREIRWHFNPPRASHMGGVWERQIRSVRKVFAAVLKQQTLTGEGFQTLLCEAMSM